MDALERAPHIRSKTFDRSKRVDASPDAVRQFTILDMPDLLPAMRRHVFAGAGCGLAAGLGFKNRLIDAVTERALRRVHRPSGDGCLFLPEDGTSSPTPQKSSKTVFVSPSSVDTGTSRRPRVDAQRHRLPRHADGAGRAVSVSALRPGLGRVSGRRRLPDLVPRRQQSDDMR